MKLWTKVGLTVLAVGAAWAWRVAPYRNPAAAFAAFKDTTRFGAEDQILDPLILCGDGVVPTLLEALRDSQMPYRRYAIRFLGRYDTPPVRERLLEIIHSPSENSLVRGDALQSLWDLDAERARSVAQQYSADTTYLGRIAALMLDTPPSDWYERRSFLDAFFGRHT
ncbi:MAG TPA: HEAT repeat domain-containing protein [Steroidobacteraceae bacterium]|nr:HEAT repeat domain-containing protein [Steroidobacteraceae bacterium]